MARQSASALARKPRTLTGGRDVFATHPVTAVLAVAVRQSQHGHATGAVFTYRRSRHAVRAAPVNGTFATRADPSATGSVTIATREKAVRAADLAAAVTATVAHATRSEAVTVARKPADHHQCRDRMPRDRRIRRHRFGTRLFSLTVVLPSI